MGSGLILLVIVGAWLAVLVPMALRSYDLSASVRQVERLGDAVRVLARRGSGALSELTTRPVAAPAEEVVAPPPPMEPFLRRFRADPPRGPVTVVQRRRRVLLTLVALTALSLVGAMLSRWLLLPAAVCLLLAVAYVVQLRRLAVRRAERQVRAAGRGPAAEPAPVAAPPLPAWSVTAWSTPLSTPAPPRTEVLPVASGEWSPVPVPPPVYVGKPVAPPRPPRSLDLPTGGSRAISAGPAAADDDLELDDILEGRRASGDW